MFFRLILTYLLHTKATNLSYQIYNPKASFGEIEANFIDLTVIQAVIKHSYGQQKNCEFEYFKEKQPIPVFYRLKDQIKWFTKSLLKFEKFKIQTDFFKEFFDKRYVFGNMENKIDHAINYLNDKSCCGVEKKKLVLYKTERDLICQLNLLEYGWLINWYIKQTKVHADLLIKDQFKLTTGHNPILKVQDEDSSKDCRSSIYY